MDGDGWCYDDSRYFEQNIPNALAPSAHNSVNSSENIDGELSQLKSPHTFMKEQYWWYIIGVYREWNQEKTFFVFHKLEVQ